MVESYTKMIENWLKTAKNVGCDLCVMIYHYIISCPEEIQPELFRYFSENLCEIKSNESQEIPEFISLRKVVEYSRAGVELLVKFIEGLYKRGVNEEEFYKNLWEYIKKSPDFADENARCVAFFNCFKSKKVPYLDTSKAVTMDNDEFSSTYDIALNSDYIKKIIKIKTFGFEQRTEEYSMILSVIDSCEDFKVRTILLMMLSDIEEKSKNPLEEFLKKRLSQMKAKVDDDFISENSETDDE